MKSLIPLLALLTFTVTAFGSDHYPASEKSSKTLPLSATGALRLANINGSIEITSWDKNEVLIETEKRAKSSEDLARIHIDIDAQPDRVVIGTSHDKTGFLFSSEVRGEVRYHLTVPASAKLEKISAVNSAITIHGVHGAVTLQTVNGSIKAVGLAGDTRLETVNGSISARFSAVAANQQIEVESVNGSCDVFLPKDVSAQVTLASVNGNASCDFPLTLERSNRRSLRGTIGSGLIAVKASTVNGSVRLIRL